MRKWVYVCLVFAIVFNITAVVFNQVMVRGNLQKIEAKAYALGLLEGFSVADPANASANCDRYHAVIAMPVFGWRSLPEPLNAPYIKTVCAMQEQTEPYIALPREKIQ